MEVRVKEKGPASVCVRMKKKRRWSKGGDEKNSRENEESDNEDLIVFAIE